MRDPETRREQFMRIAMARLKNDYPFRPQRCAIAAKMWTKYVNRYDFNFKELDGQIL